MLLDDGEGEEHGIFIISISLSLFVAVVVVLLVVLLVVVAGGGGGGVLVVVGVVAIIGFGGRVDKSASSSFNNPHKSTLDGDGDGNDDEHTAQAPTTTTTTTTTRSVGIRFPSAQSFSPFSRQCRRCHLSKKQLL